MNLCFSLLFLLLAGCAQTKLKPADKTIATDSIAQGKVSAIVQKEIKNKDLCFNITLNMKDVGQEYARASNWSLAWIDNNNRYHLLSLVQRRPAAEPHNINGVWTNNFWTCDNKLKLEALDSLLLTPKTFPFRESDGLKFQWN